MLAFVKKLWKVAVSKDRESHLDRPLRVAHLPLNIRWIMDNIVKGQQELGIETRKMFISSLGVDDPSVEPMNYAPTRNPTLKYKGYPTFIRCVIKYFGRYAKLIWWADIVHWQYSNRVCLPGGAFTGFDFFLLRLLRKPTVAQFHGMEFLDNRMWFKENPWWEESFPKEEMDFFNELAETTQRDFAAAGIFFAMGHGMLPSVKEENRENSFLLERSVDVTSIPVAKKTKHDKVRIAHTPSTPQKKGTPYVLEAIEEIQKERDIEFVLLTGLSHEELLSQIGDADIVIDQLLCGDYGVAAVEAMAVGTAVVVNVCDSLQEAYPDTLPVFSATPETIKEVLLDLIDNPEKREKAAIAGPEYARLVHSIESTAPEVLRIYKEAALRKGRKKIAKRVDYYLEKCRELGWQGSANE